MYPHGPISSAASWSNEQPRRLITTTPVAQVGPRWRHIVWAGPAPVTTSSVVIAAMPLSQVPSERAYSEKRVAFHHVNLVAQGRRRRELRPARSAPVSTTSLLDLKGGTSGVRQA